MAVQSCWVHGSAAELERENARSADSKDALKRVFDATSGNRWFVGDIADVGSYAGIGCVRISRAARFLPFDDGDQDLTKSGALWANYPIPTPATVDGARAKVKRAMVNYELTDPGAVFPSEMHIWDGNRRIFVQSAVDFSADRFNGGIKGETHDPNARPDENRLWREDVNQEIFFGVMVCINIRFQDAKDEYMDIRSVGVEFEV